MTVFESPVEIVVEEFANFRDLEHPGKVVPRVWRAQLIVTTDKRLGYNPPICIMQRWSSKSEEHARKKIQRAREADRAREAASVSKCFAVAGEPLPVQ